MHYLKFIFALFCIASPLHSDEAKEEKAASKEEKSDDTSSKDKKAEDTKSDSCKKDETPPAPPRIGNFSLPTSQQPNRLFSFGNTLIDKNVAQAFFFADDFVGKHKKIVTLFPYIDFGLSDDCAVLLTFPYVPENRELRDHSTGLGDFSVQVECSVYSKTTYCYEDQATVLAAIVAPTGSIIRRPATGFGSTAFFVGATYNRMMVDWFMFACEGAFLTTSEHGFRQDNQFLYQGGIGRNIPSPCGWIYAWLVEVDGQYSQKNSNKGVIDHNTGGNVIYVTPSLWVSSKYLLAQFGVSFPVNQNLFGNQPKFDYALNFALAWTFY